MFLDIILKTNRNSDKEAIKIITKEKKGAQQKSSKHSTETQRTWTHTKLQAKTGKKKMLLHHISKAIIFWIVQKKYLKKLLPLFIFLKFNKLKSYSHAQKFVFCTQSIEHFISLKNDCLFYRLTLMIYHWTYPEKLYNNINYWK